jgi:hypothetical protein
VSFSGTLLGAMEVERGGRSSPSGGQVAAVRWKLCGAFLPSKMFGLRGQEFVCLK